ncbi:hypothetical protein [uncultured Ramlibacter sp.]|uniref:hypothetical protein n=1 Tax=uncultured Ramlibacter sp. TaxID=260755 RepID=UPI00261582ED|nr:hypothetical protein [uncultured Ramlibacter sp.]
MQSFRQIELCGYAPGDLELAEAEICQMRSPLADWQVWNATLADSDVLPDVSVIDTRGKNWSAVFRLVNEAHGSRIVLLGNDAPRIGLQVVPTASRLEEAIDEALHDSGFGIERAPDTLPAPLAECRAL